MQNFVQGAGVGVNRYPLKIVDLLIKLMSYTTSTRFFQDRSDVYA